MEATSSGRFFCRRWSARKVMGGSGCPSAAAYRSGRNDAVDDDAVAREITGERMKLTMPALAVTT